MSQTELEDTAPHEPEATNHKTTIDAVGRIVAWVLPAVVLLLVFLKLDTPTIGGDGLAYYAWLHSIAQDGDLSLANEYESLKGEPDLYQLFEVPETGRVGTAFPFGSGFLWTPIYKASLWLGETRWYAQTVAPHIDETSYLQRPGVGFLPGLAMALGTNLMTLVSVYLALDIARRFVPLLVASLSVLAVFVGTPLLYYSTIEPSMAHAPATLITTLLFWLFFRFGMYSGPGQRERLWVWLLTGLALGLATTVRWQLALLGVPFALLLLYQRRWKSFGAFCLGALMLLWTVPAVWHHMFGKILVLPASHQDPRAFVPGLRSPLGIWFSGQSGLITWAPVVALSVSGILLSAKRFPQIAFVFLVSFLLESLMSASVIDWWAGWSFGTRRMTELYALYALGLGLFVGFPASRGWQLGWDRAVRHLLTAVGLVLTAAAVLWSLALLFTYANGFIHPEWGTVGDATRFLGDCSLTGYLSHRDQFTGDQQSPSASAARSVQGTTPVQPDFLEPRVLSVPELTGLVPDEILRGTVLSSGESTGIVIYESGVRVEDTVVITSTIYPRISTPSWAPNNMLTVFGCLGQTPHSGYLGGVVPSSVLRLYDTDGVDVTSEIQYMYVSQMDGMRPHTDPIAPSRYPERDYGSCRTSPLPIEQKGLEIPANSGCRIWIPGADYYPLTGVFTITDPASLQVDVTGSQQATFRSSVGPESAGAFQPLMDEMIDLFGWRQDRIPLSVPEGTDYFLTRFPPMPGDAFTDSLSGLPNLNVDRLSSAPFRLSLGEASMDLAISGAYPMAIFSQDTSEAPRDVLPPTTEAAELALPGYVLAAGVPFQPCFTQGDCPKSVLAQVSEAEMPIEITYLSLANPQGVGSWVPLRSPGPVRPVSPLDSHQAPSNPALGSDRTAFSESESIARLFLPIVTSLPRDLALPRCPCGWFDTDGRMLGFSIGDRAE
ncbi:hypothetical protein ACFLT5_01300 [Chloroflexota bacterium]